MTHLILLHGYGANGADLGEIGKMLQSQLPDLTYESPNAPNVCAVNPMGFEWFGLNDMSLTEVRNGVEAASKDVESIIGDRDDYVLAGFSQGAMLALHVGLRIQNPPKAILAFSGLLAHPVPKNPPSIPILLAHGDADEVVPAAGSMTAHERLQEAGLAPNLHIMPALGHGIDDSALRAALKVLQSI